MTGEAPESGNDGLERPRAKPPFTPRGDYTKDRAHILPDLTDEELLAKADEFAKRDDRKTR